MKKSKLMFLVAFLSAFSAVLVMLYLLKDHIKECTVCGKFFGHEEEDDFLDDDLFDDIEIPEKEEKEEKPTAKVRRGYIPLKFHHQ